MAFLPRPGKPDSIMSNRGQHFRQAERLLDDLPELPPKPSPMDIERRILAVGEARAHAQLASVSNEVFNEYLDLTYTEHLRDEVVGTPAADTRDWLKDDDQG